MVSVTALPDLPDTARRGPSDPFHATHPVGEFVRSAPTAPPNAERLFELVGRSTTDVIGVVDIATLRWVYISPSVVRQTGYTAEETMAWTPGANSGDPDGVRAYLLETVRRFEAGDDSVQVTRFDTLQRHRNGSAVETEVVITLLAEEDRRVSEALVVARDVTDQRRAHREIRDREHRFRTLFDQMPVGIVYQDTDGRVTMANDAARTILGLTGGRTIDELRVLHEDGTPAGETERPGRRAVALRQSVRDVVFGVDVPGRETVTWVSASSTPLLDDDGEPVEVFTLLTDVTRERLAAEELRLKEAAMSSAGSAIAIVDMDDMAVYVNDALVTMWRFESREAALAVSPLSYWADPAQIMPGRAAVNAGRAWSGEAVARRMDGSTFHAQLAVSPVFDSHGRLVRRMLSVMDVTERVELQRRSQHLTEQLEKAQELAHIGSWEVDLVTHVVRWSDEARRISDVGSAPISAAALAERIHPDDRPVIDAAFAAAAAGGPHPEFEFRYVYPNGKVQWLRLRSQLEFDDDGAPVRLVGTVQDVTDHHRAMDAERLEEEKEIAERANQAKSAFLASMSHEIRTPMTAVLGFSQLLQEDATLTDRQRELLGMISRSGEHLLQLIDDVLQMSKIEAHHVAIEPVELDLDGLLADLRAIFELRTRSNGVEITFTRDPVVPSCVRIDALRLRQIMINLIGNAVKFTTEGSITVRLRAGDGSPAPWAPGRTGILVVEVSDTGPGIAPENLGRIFERFEQTEVGRSVHGGTGLGLAICKGLSELMGGGIAVRSTLGEGATFTVTVPVAAVDRQDVGVDPGTAGSTVPTRTGRILIADDAPENRMVMAMMLESAGHEVRAAVDGLDAVEQFEAWDPEVVILDLQMPRLDGLGAMRRLRESPRGSTVRILAATANVFEDDRREVEDAGGDGFVPKPFSKAQLLQAVQAELARLP